MMDMLTRMNLPLAVDRVASEARTIEASRLHSMFAPRSIVFVGASESSGWFRSTYNNLQQGGFPGRIYCVNANHQTILGHEVFPNISSLPEAVDLAFVLVGAQNVPGVMAECAAAGIRNLEIVAADFAESGPEGRRRQDQLADLARENQQLILGPNNLGFINLSDDIVAFSQPITWPLMRGGVSLLSHSGGLAGAAMDYFMARDVGVNFVIALGNEASIDVVDGINYLLEDEGTRVIALFIEAIRRPLAFKRVAARAATLGKPIVMCKIGRGHASTPVIAAHTGAIVGNDGLIDVASKQLAVVRVDSIEDLVLTSGVFDSYGEFAGNRIGIVTQSGGMCGAMADTAERLGLKLPTLSDQTCERLKNVLPPFATAQNPLDVTGFVVNDPEMPRKAREILFEDPNLDVVVLTTRLPRSESELVRVPLLGQLLRGIAESIHGAEIQVVLVSFFPSDYGEFARQLRADLDLPLVVAGASQGLSALARAIWWSNKRKTLCQVEDPMEREWQDLSKLGTHGPRNWSETNGDRFLDGSFGSRLTKQIMVDHQGQRTFTISVECDNEWGPIVEISETTRPSRATPIHARRLLPAHRSEILEMIGELFDDEDRPQAQTCEVAAGEIIGMVRDFAVDFDE